MTDSPGTDRDILTQKAYASDDLLSVRQRTHEQYSFPRLNFSEWVLERLTWRGDEIVLDIGAGPGTYFEGVQARIPNGRLVAGDLSMGMVRIAAQHPQAGSVINADAQAIPFPDHTFDVVLANHMLFHVPDLDRGLTEIRRVLKPAGCLLAATNSEFNLPELEQLIRRTFGLLGATQAELEALKPPTHNFQLEDGPVKLARHFFAVARYDLPGAFIFPEMQPVIDYVNSVRALREPQLPRRTTWEDFISLLAEQVQRLINHFGELIISKLSGALVATDSGDFAADYVRALAKHSGQ
jgi:SAM-dependent methyltransferase